MHAALITFLAVLIFFAWFPLALGFVVLCRAVVNHVLFRRRVRAEMAVCDRVYQQGLGVGIVAFQHGSPPPPMPALPVTRFRPGAPGWQRDRAHRERREIAFACGIYQGWHQARAERDAYDLEHLDELVAGR